MNVFWFKRDLRVEDNEALSLACNVDEPLLLIYILEPSLVENGHTSARHINFIKETLVELSTTLKAYDTTLLLVKGEVIPTFKKLLSHHRIQKVFSTQEIGINITYERDLKVARWFEENAIVWIETQYNGVIRGLKNRDGWSAAWQNYMKTDVVKTPLDILQPLPIAEVRNIQTYFDSIDLSLVPHSFQKGGRSAAITVANSFFEDRISLYSEGISKPELSRKTCSRLSPYFAWGVLSIREIYKKTLAQKAIANSKKPYNAFISRLKWQSHFIQKFEMEPRMEFEAINRAYLEMPQVKNEHYIAAWKEGLTGYPLVDASIRCLKHTGYLNFRMRSMVVSFYTHHLFQHFRYIGDWLAQQFLDFEPGIHYGQIQMQSGFTGTNTIRIYNPTKNAHDHDPEALFIKKWVPALKNLPANLAIEPWLITPLEESMYQFQVGATYPERVVDIQETRKVALQSLYEIRKTPYALQEKERILNKHTIKRTR